MVRLKHRYLLLQILYPDSQAALPGSLARGGLPMQPEVTQNARSALFASLKYYGDGRRFQ